MNLTRFENNSKDSLFDSIRRYDENGHEYWLARELMTLMGYQSWRRFETPIAQAIENLELSGDVVSDHFDSNDKVVKRPQGGGSKQVDYKLSRYACYMTALSCDGRKPEVALAKKYFAVKTRQAEVLDIKPKTALELAKEQVKLLEQIEVQNQIIESQNQDLLRQAEVIDELFNYSSIIRVAKFNKCSEKKFSYHRLKAVSQQMGIEIKKVPSPRFEYQNLYSHDAWRVAYPDYQLPETVTLRVA